MKIHNKRLLPVRIILGIMVLFTLFIYDARHHPATPQHSCRLWGIVFSDLNIPLQETIRTHLDALKSLGSSNPDGWGIGYYILPDTGAPLPIISKGEPSAPYDPRYDKAVEELVTYIDKAAIGHVRNATSGLLAGIPDPHPFVRKTINRDLNILFAHNGHVSINVLLNLMIAIDPSYADCNPPDYTPNFLDSDLLFIYLLEYIDTYPTQSIETCIKMAIVRLASALGSEPAVLNFIMATDSTLWVLHFAEHASDYYTLYYYPNLPVSNFWVAASVPLDTMPSFWSAVPNSTLVTLIPNQPPKFTSIYTHADTPPFGNSRDSLWLEMNPSQGHTQINYLISSASWVNMNIYDIEGRRLRNLLSMLQTPGCHTIIWDGKDNNGNNLPPGTYFCKFKSENYLLNRKIVLLR